MVVTKLRAVKAESVRCSKTLAIDRNRIDSALVNILEEAISSVIVTNVLVARLTLHQYLNAKHEGCIVRVRTRSLRKKGIEATGEA